MRRRKSAGERRLAGNLLAASTALPPPKPLSLQRDTLVRQVRRDHRDRIVAAVEKE
jgi:hypothetical protein